MVKSDTSNQSSFSNIRISSLFQKNDFLVKGSESFIYFGQCFNKKVIIKERRPKHYRDPKLDIELRLHRLRIESKMIKSALNNSIDVPALISVDLNSFSLALEHIPGKSLGSLLNATSIETTNLITTNFLKEFGKIVAKLHNTEIIHGDLTPLNILVANENQIFIIDFGLAFYSNEIKDKSMDLFILYGALKIYSNFEYLFENFLQGYKSANEFSAIMESFDKLTRKGRYKE